MDSAESSPHSVCNAAALSLMHQSPVVPAPYDLICRAIIHTAHRPGMLRERTRGSAKLKIAYLVHDLSDPAVHRRVRMLKSGSARLVVIGFRRSAECPKEIEGCQAIDLGETKDGALLARIGSVASVRMRLGRFEDLLRDCQVVLARNLEMLYLAVAARRCYAPSAALVFECLDIHRLLLGEKLPSQLLRSLEARFMRDVDLILTSSPRFVSEYFGPRQFNCPIEILENKVLLADNEMIVRIEQPAPISGPPWKLGWFGMIRCRRSFEILSSAVRELGGALQVIIAGRPSPKEFPDFEALVAQAPHVAFIGAYRFDELPALYGGVHFSWAVDFFEEGLNSAWLLPNRVYESSFFGAVPIAIEGVETAHWLQHKKIGVILNGDPKTSLQSFVRGLNNRRYLEMIDALQRVPTTELADTRESCQQLVRMFKNLNAVAGMRF
jgi:succinoglycan biosynthesis protein ExoL